MHYRGQKITNVLYTDHISFFITILKEWVREVKKEMNGNRQKLKKMREKLTLEHILTLSPKHTKTSQHTHEHVYTHNQTNKFTNTLAHISKHKRLFDRLFDSPLWRLRVCRSVCLLVFFPSRNRLTKAAVYK